MASKEYKESAKTSEGPSNKPDNIVFMDDNNIQAIANKPEPKEDAKNEVKLTPRVLIDTPINVDVDVNGDPVVVFD